MSMAQRGHFYPSDQFSSSLITDLCQDREGSVWIATDYGLNRFDGYHFQTFLHDDADSTSLGANIIVTLLCDRNGRLWVGTNKGLDLYDNHREEFRHYAFPGGTMPRVTSLMQRRDGTLLVGTAGYGAFLLASPDGQLQNFSLNNVDNYFSRQFEDSEGRLWRSGFDEEIYVRTGDEQKQFHSPYGTPAAYMEKDGLMLVLCMHGMAAFRNGEMTDAGIDMSVVAGKDVIFTRMVESPDGTVYIGTRGNGLYRLNGKRLERVEASAKGIDLATAKISAMLIDRRGNLWMGCHRKGLIMLPQRPMQFSNWSFEEQGINLGSTIGSVCEGDGGITWCTVQGVGVYGFNAKGHVVAHPQAPDAVEFIFRDRQQRFWIGTDDGLFAYDPLTGRSQLRVTFDCDKFNDMTSDNQGNIYISTFSRGFCVYNPQTGSLLNHNFNEELDSVKGRLCNNWVMGLTADKEGLIWMATASGISCYDPTTDNFRSQGWNQLLNGTICFSVCELHTGTLADGRQLNDCIAIGTEHGLYLYYRNTRQVEPFPGGEQLKNKAISYIVQSNDGDIWCSTSMGIWQYQQSSRSFIGHVSGNGLTQVEYLYGVGMHTDKDLILFGHNDGLSVFSPKMVKESYPLLDSLQLTAFRVGDQYVKKGTVINGVEVTNRAVCQSNYFTLSYLDHTVMLAFSQFTFDDPTNIVLEYSINNGNWISNPGGQNNFTLGHLQPGTYRIAVRALQGSNYTPEKVVVVTIRAPWYKSLFAYFIYVLIALSLLGYVLYTYRRRANQRLNEEKMTFFINATHDIRSPLTLILGALKKLKTTQNEQESAALNTIERNSKRILDLVNQILDVRKIDKQQMQLHCQSTDLVAFVRSIYKMYEYNAKENNIDFRFEADAESIEAWVDRSQFDKVVANLLSNAFKYCGDSGTVKLALTHDEKDVKLQVTDSGDGLDADNMKHVFDRFYQGSNSLKLKVSGTGIGLNLCKMIVDMHHGTIQAQNRADGEKGAQFTVTLPLGNKHLTEAEIEQAEQQPQPLPEKEGSCQAPSQDNAAPGNGAAATPAQGAAKGTSSHRHVLVVDDDEEIAAYIATELGRYYKFSTAANGKEGLKELLTHDYDLVISDVMMPEMDGFTMLRMIKTNMNISHLPVIMLTSKADVGNRLEGLERGADAFLAKPFDMDELHLTIDNLIRSRQRLKGKFTGAQQQADKVEAPEVKGNDEILMERIMKAVNKNLSNSDFNVDMLTQEVGISRAQLHRKMKEMTGISTSEFIRNIRLEQAARLLKEQKINVTQVAYTVGFSNLAHFSTIFRKHFGVAPSEYAEREA
jgi:signal transduction histidine kinase/ligand-binding sensor domain-containing protein/DNA-binding response OmpR family regulator